MITRVIQHYYPHFECREDNYGWVKVLCPFHGESNPSATVNEEIGRFKCWSCGFNEDAFGVIMHEEGVGFGVAKERLREILGASSIDVLGAAPRKREGKRVPSWKAD